ncbi:MAG: T9SS type A sorting domain-containing protein [Bacteroidetes bacterium]|nr:T9SS type A sorting domain-containing protein [Bacteroidota bacterium]
MNKLLPGIILAAIFLSSYQANGQLHRMEDETIITPNHAVESTNPVAPSPAVLSKFTVAPAPCISAELKQSVMVENRRNKEALRQTNPGLFQRNSSVTPTFIWPTQPKSGFSDYGYYTINYLVDHNFSFPNQWLDYNCSNRTYDWGSGNHEGTDIILWPYGWKKMDDNVMEIVAAAPGIIINKNNSFFDRVCVNAGNPNWNGIIIEHADGSQAWYWHFQTGSATTKNIGDAIVAGEYLGRAGSSGSSNYPHLHFQVMDSVGGTIDPWQGSCNSMNSNSWWQNQQPYNVPSVNRICTKQTQLEYYNCPTPETTNEVDTFALGDSLWLWVYTRDLEFNSQMQLNIYNPSGTNVLNWQFVIPWATTATGYIRWYYVIDPWWVDGTWIFESVYGGNSYQHQFVIDNSTGLNDQDGNSPISIKPNPATDFFHIELPENTVVNTIEVFDQLGKLKYAFNENESTGNTKKIVDCSNFNNGVYFVKVQTDNGVYTSKLVKQ